MVTVIENAKILAGDEMHLIENGYIVIEGRVIRDLGSGKASIQGKKIDAQHTIVMPTFVNAHTHVGDSIAKDVGMNLTLDELVMPPSGLKHRLLASTPNSELIEGMRDTAMEMLASGIAIFADFREGGVDGVKLLLKAVKDLPIKPTIFGRLGQQPFTESELDGNEQKLSPTAIKEVKGVLALADGISSASANDFTDTALQQLREVSSKMLKKRAIHVAESPSSYTMISKRRTGRSDVKRVLDHFTPDFVVHMTNAEQEDIELICRRRIPVVCCPRANCRIGVGFPPIMQIHRKGALVALGTDNVMLNAPDMFEEMDFTSKMIRGLERNPAVLPPVEVLKMATINGARLLGVSGSMGSIEAGKFANMIFVDSNSRNLRPMRDPISSIVHRVRRINIRAVMIEGKVVVGSLSK